MAARRLDRVVEQLSPAAHRQSKYVPAPPLPGRETLPLPPPTPSVEQAKRDLSTHGLCVLTGALSPQLLRRP
eukprot:gene9702-3052_t